MATERAAQPADPPQPMGWMREMSWSTADVHGRYEGLRRAMGWSNECSGAASVHGLEWRERIATATQAELQWPLGRADEPSQASDGQQRTHRGRKERHRGQMDDEGVAGRDTC